jgi:hypothetical protein
MMEAAMSKSQRRSERSKESLMVKSQFEHCDDEVI